MNNNLILLLPVYNDWISLNQLLKDLDKKILVNNKVRLIVVNDKSNNKIQISNDNIKYFETAIIINLKKNIGNQRAIAVGLNYIKKNFYNQKIVLMDSDGEDSPKLLEKILLNSNKFKKKIIVVNRISRKDGVLLKIFYEIYFLFCLVLIHKFIRFGNFSLICSEHLKKIFIKNDIWFAYPSAILNSSIKIKNMFAKKENRYAGLSSMNLLKLLNHALRVIVVFRHKIFFTLFLYNILFLIIFKINFWDMFSIILSFCFVIINYGYYFKEKKKIPNNFLSLIKNIKKIK